MSMITMSGVTVPARKRRRPALSCIECRRRKIKCDRNMPCNHCIQSKNAVCSYKDLHPSAHSRTARTTEKTAPTPLSANDYLGDLDLAAVPCPRRCPNLGVTDDHLFDVNSLPRSVPSLTDGSQSEREPGISPSVYHTAASPPENNDPDGSGNPARRSGDLSTISCVAFGSPQAIRESDDSMSMMGINFSTFEDLMIQDGDGRNTLRTKVFKNTNSTPINDYKGTLCKTRYFGQSHWMFVLKQFPPLCRFNPDDNILTNEATGQVREALEKCKRMARAAKAERPIKWHTNPNFKDYIPPRDVSDKLVSLYLRTCESHYRILHIPSFIAEYNDYWRDPSSATTASTIKILLVMAIGTCFDQEEGNEDLRSMAQQWVYSAQSWTAAPFEKSRLNLPGIQIHCLLVLARQTNAVGGDLIWTAAGTLLRTAFQMGFHRDPKHFPKVPLFVAYMRRRIWATTLEMAIQTSLEAGMPPLIALDDFDTEPPANVDDEEIWPSMTALPRSKPNDVYTQTSIQIILTSSQCTRLRIVYLLNKFQSGPTYDRVLSLDRDVTDACNDACRLMKVFSASERRPTALQRILLDILIRRYLLHMHIPFCVQSTVDPRYYYSRNVCLDAALAIFFHSGAADLPLGLDPHIVDDYARLKLVGGGIFKEIMLHAATIITVELLRQLEDDVKSGLPPSIQKKATRQPLYQAVEDIITLTAARIREGENNAKGHLFLSAASAQIQAMTNGVRPEDVVPEAAKQSALHCLELLRARTKMPPDTPTESDVGTNVSGGMESLEDLDYGFNVFLPDANLNLEVPDSWIFTGWELN